MSFWSSCSSTFGDGMPVNATLDEEKRALRSRIRGELRALVPRGQQEGGEALAHRLEGWLEGSNGAESGDGFPGASPPGSGTAPSIATLFASLPWEVDTGPTAHLLGRRGYTIALPDYASGELVFRTLPPGTGFANLPRDRMGIPTPFSEFSEVDPLRAHLLLVPGVAFDGEGRRLGQGGGYYDRMLHRLRTEAAEAGTLPPPAIGLALDLQVVERIPAGPHDERVDGVLTPGKGLRWVPSD